MKNNLPLSMGTFRKFPFGIGQPLSADKMAMLSCIMGSSSFLSALFPEHTIFLEIPFSIPAIIYGNLALKKGTRLNTIASIGKVLGITVIFALVVEFLMAFILIACSNNRIVM
jgi:hypothetical protein